MSDAKYTVTIYTAAPGTPLLASKTGQPRIGEDGEPLTSQAGHMFYVISDGSKRNSYGFAPVKDGDFNGPGRLADDDEAVYTNPRYARTLEITKKQYDKLKAFGEDFAGHGFKPHYNGLYRNCVDFTWKGLDQAGIHRDLWNVVPWNGKADLRVLENINDIRSIPPPVPDSPLNQERMNPLPANQNWIQRRLTELQLDDPTHPGQALFQQAYAGVQKLNAKYGVAPSPERDGNFAGTLAVGARAHGMERIDHVLLSNPPDHSQVFAVEGPLQNPDRTPRQLMRMDVAQALATPLAQSSAEWNQAVLRGDQVMADERAQTAEHRQRLAQHAQQDVPQPRSPAVIS
jgi:hypothetical protein